MILGTYLKNIRNNEGLSLKNVCERTGITNSRLSRLENGKTIPSIDDLISLFDCYNISLLEALQELGYINLSKKELSNLNLLNDFELSHIQKEIDFIISHRNEAMKNE